MLRVLGGFIGACLILVLVVPPMVAIWWLIIYPLLWLEIRQHLWPMFPSWGFWWGLFVAAWVRGYLPYWLVKAVFAIPELNYEKNFASLKVSLKFLSVFVSEALFLAFALWQQVEHLHDNHWFWANWVFFGVWYLPFTDFLIRLLKEEASCDGARLVQHRMLFEERDLIPSPLQGPYPTSPEWLKTSPRWVGEAVEENPLYRFWMGFLDTALHVLRWIVWIDKKRVVADKPLGDAHVASVDDTYEAGL